MISNNILAVVFPGQSSQHIGMLLNLANHFELIKETFSEVSEILNYDMWKLIQYGPIHELNKTYRSQPAILTASVAIWRVWKKQGGRIPDIMAGHSLGEYSALVCAGSIDLLSAVKLVIVRGKLMQETMPYGSGSMSAIIGLDNSIVLEYCSIVSSKTNQVVAPASFNAPENIIIAGHKSAVDQVNLLCKNVGAKYVLVLPISVPSHCILMKPMIKKFQQELEKVIFCLPKIPIINNTDACIETKSEDIRNALIRQLYTPVRWNEIIQNFINRKVTVLIEMGPGKILSRLLKVTTNNILGLSINDFHSLSKAMEIY